MVYYLVNPVVAIQKNQLYWHKKEHHTIKISHRSNGKWNHRSKNMYVRQNSFCMYTCVCMHACVFVSKLEDMICGKPLSSSTLCVWGIELRSLSLVASVFTNRTILPTHKHVFLKLYWKIRYSKWQISHPKPQILKKKKYHYRTTKLLQKAEQTTFAKFNS